MDSDTIEKTAVNAVESAILRAGNFTPLLNKNDTVPSWDGEIIVYKGGKKTKSNIVDTIPVQIKGTIVDKRVDGKLRYSVKVTDLKNYLNCKSGTVLYFVVFIEEGEEESKKTIYYLKLLPFDLKWILAGCANQESITLDFLPFPIKKQEISCLIYDVASDMQKQRACIHAEPVTLESLFKESDTPTLTLGRTFACGDKAPSLLDLIGHDYYFYATRQDNVNQPAMHARIDGIAYTIPYPVLVNGVEYYPEHKRIEYVNSIVLKVSEAIEFILPKDDSLEMKLCIHASWKLLEDIRDTSFLLGLFEHKELQLGELVLPCDLMSDSVRGINMEVLKQHLETCQMIQKLMDAMDVTSDFDFSQLKKEQWGGLCRLYGFIIEGNRARIEFESDYAVIEPDIGNLKILLFAVADKQNEHCYEIRSFSDARNIVISKEGNQTSPFVGLSIEQILHVDNIRYENFFQQLETIPLSKNHVKGVTHLFYKLLLAYDKSGDKRPDILTNAINIAEWLECHDCYSDQVYKVLNKMEAIKRYRQLNEQENEELFNIAEHTELPPIYRSFAYVLLGEQKCAARLFKQVPESIQNVVREYPIFRFWKEEK